MVLLQPDLDISSDDDDWVLLDSVMRNNNDYDKIFEQYKLTETRIQTIPAHDCRRRFSLDFSWLWIFPVVALMFATIRLVQREYSEIIFVFGFFVFIQNRVQTKWVPRTWVSFSETIFAL